MDVVNRRAALRLGVGGATAVVLGATEGQGLAAPAPAPGPQGPPEPPGPESPGLCTTDGYRGYAVTVCPGGKVDHGLLTNAVLLDDQPLIVMAHQGAFISILNQHETHPSLPALAMDAVHQLNGASLQPLPSGLPEVPGELQIPSSGRSRTAPPRRPVVRRNIASLSRAERETLVDALMTLKDDGRYDFFVAVHQRAFVTPEWGAHMNPAFLPWHRAYINLFEEQLRDAGARALPYWEWSTQRTVGELPFTDDLLGGDGYHRPGPDGENDPREGEVLTGPFAFSTGNWPITVSEDDRDFLRRDIGRRVRLPSGPADVRSTMRQRRYDKPPFDRTTPAFRGYLEGWAFRRAAMHGSAHAWIGGNMSTGSSPNDPAFFLNHCYVDKIWADWQARYPSARHYEPVSAPSSDVPGLDTPLEPFRSAMKWTVTPRMVLDHRRQYVYR